MREGLKSEWRRDQQIVGCEM